MEPLIKKTTAIRVNYFDTDQMGVVWHGNYIKYFEIAREDLFRSAGIPYSKVEEMGIMMPIVDVSVQYKSPALYDQTVMAESRVSEMPKSTIRVDYTISSLEGRIIATGHTTLAFINSSSRRPCRPPKELMEVLSN